MKIKTDNIFQVVELEASASDVFHAWMDEKIHARFTGSPARIENREGGRFESGGICSGYTLFLEENKRIVQSITHKDFPAGLYSTVVIDLEKTEHGTRINLNHLGVPEECSGWMTETWKKSYLEPLRDFLGEKAVVNH